MKVVSQGIRSIVTTGNLYRGATPPYAKCWGMRQNYTNLDGCVIFLKKLAGLK